MFTDVVSAKLWYYDGGAVLWFYCTYRYLILRWLVLVEWITEHETLEV